MAIERKRFEVASITCNAFYPSQAHHIVDREAACSLDTVVKRPDGLYPLGMPHLILDHGVAHILAAELNEEKHGAYGEGLYNLVQGYNDEQLYDLVYNTAWYKECRIPAVDWDGMTTEDRRWWICYASHRHFVQGCYARELQNILRSDHARMAPSILHMVLIDTPIQYPYLTFRDREPHEYDFSHLGLFHNQVTITPAIDCGRPAWNITFDWTPREHTHFEDRLEFVDRLATKMGLGDLIKQVRR